MTASAGTLVAVRLPLDPGPPIEPFALAGATGIVFRTVERTLVGLGRARTLTLPHGLVDAAAVEALSRSLSAMTGSTRPHRG